ncbi:two-component system, OmpR family, sensor kinase/two-component system, OmpR family, phosphate regulon sensor histidine kinase PhoR [Porphyromonadaceae bacterium KH3R12]|uniref:ATP-binding protein n=1 Tax=Proteiniphilum TaxID=294702 RepID=UPI00089BDF77|nr:MULTISPECIES: ATP-binding protein [Proteiniphilum]MDY9919734.1 ATP-binding protein [Proteiniphilum sp.]SEA38229.1 two-component system, OmpR family, sensor kinase/two-component system, OmpR family, phosphate regulon sensor histidine kinase PhoR [Porphyromonadaceae bacterium KH3R12]
MKRKVSFKTRILLNFSVIIGLFTVGIILFEQQQFKNERTLSLERTLENNADIVYRYLNENSIDLQKEPERVGELLRYMPSDVRFTIINWEGRVLYDNFLDVSKMENHLKRPEVQKSIGFGNGSNIRISDSDNIKYLYYSKKYNEGYFIRLAVPYDVKLQSFINSGSSFIIYILLFFVVCILMMLYFSNRFSRSLKELREFSLNVRNDVKIPASFVFADDEVGEVSADIVENYNLLQENRRKLAAEREKLLQHFQLSEEGIAIFSKDRREIYANSHFLQFLNMILDNPTLETELIFEDPIFSEFVNFLNTKPREGNIFSKRIEKSGRQFNVRIIIFEDESFEFYISDITKSEKTRLLKQEMTNNIAHELRTPVTSIRGYLETILNLYDDKGDNNERIHGFLDRAYTQTIRLSELIQDISMLTKIEEAPDRFEQEQVNMKELLRELRNDLSDKLKEKSSTFNVDVSDNVVVYGSRTLLYSIFRNLIENAISYGGENIDIMARCYNENENTYFFEFYDTGTGVDEKHLVRIFERFYRVSEGRTRNTGGSGLGLSIVRNAVLFHKGSIVAKNRPEGGLRFLMTFPKIIK